MQFQGVLKFPKKATSHTRELHFTAISSSQCGLGFRFVWLRGGFNTPFGGFGVATPKWIGAWRDSFQVQHPVLQYTYIFRCKCNKMHQLLCVPIVHRCENTDTGE